MRFFHGFTAAALLAVTVLAGVLAQANEDVSLEDTEYWFTFAREAAERDR